MPDRAHLPVHAAAHDDEVLRFIGQQALFGLGTGYVGAHLLASARLTPAGRLSLAAGMPH